MKVVESIINFILTIDIKEIIYAAVGAFLGFGFAILAEGLFEHQKDKNERKKLNHNLFDELEGIAESLRGHTEDQVSIVFDTPVWSSIISTGILLTLLEYDERLYDQIMMIYNRIYILQIAERNQMVERNNPKTIDLIKQLRSEIIEDIDALNGQGGKIV